jgi:hypothetical protein
MFIYVEAILTPIVAAHQAERERLLRRTQSLAEGELRQILRGDAVDVGTASQRLRYRLDRWHLGFILWSDNVDDDDTPAQLDEACATWSNGSASRAMRLSCRPAVRCCTVG